MSWREETHGVQIELVRHFLRRMFDGEWSSSPGQWRSAAIGVFSLFLPAGLLLVREGTPDANYSSKYRLLALAGATEGLRAAAIADEIALLTLLACVTGLIALLEWQSLFPSGRDYLALASLPVRSRQVFTARFMSVLLFTAVIVAAMNLLPSLISPIEFGGAWRLDSSYALHAGAQEWPPVWRASSSFLRFWHCRACCSMCFPRTCSHACPCTCKVRWQVCSYWVDSIAGR